MSDELLPYYEKELAFFRNLSAQFAEKHPRIASRLRLQTERAEDPHVERMIEAFAYLNARIRHKLDDDFPEITQALLDVLYPHYLAPIPSMAIVELGLDRAQGELTSGYTIAKGTMIETDPIDGDPCRFQTCYPVTLWPLEVSEASLSTQPFEAPPLAGKAEAVIRLKLDCFSGDVSFSQLALDSLRFYLKAQDQHVYTLLELIFHNTAGIALADSPRDREPVILDSKKCISPVGFERNEGMLPYSSRSFLGYRLLSEYFSFPAKFLFFDLGGLGPAVLQKFGSSMEVFLYLNRSVPDLEPVVTRDTFQLGCTPMINLFPKRAEPIRLTHQETEYRVVPDAYRPLAMEIYSIDRVTATSPSNEQVEYQPFYSFKHASAGRDQSTFWHASRRPSDTVREVVDRGTEMFISLVDLDLARAGSTDWILDVETTCLNRDLPRRLPFGGGQPRLHLSEGGPIESVTCLTPPTPTYRPSLRHGTLWRLISHLSLNHLSLVDYEAGADALREILKLYDVADSKSTRDMIDGILSVRSSRVVGRTDSSIAAGFCRGVQVQIHFDEQERFTGSGVYLFASVLDRFLGLYTSINSFSQLVATTNKREERLTWPRRAGEKILF